MVRILTVIAMLAAACADAAAPVDAEVCAGYSAWQTSVYVLPYATGSAYHVIQGNCAPPGDGHRGVDRFSYDFDTPIGTAFVAARGGTVLHVEQSHVDGDVAPSGLDNYIVVRHADGSAALYGHIAHAGSAVAVGDVVQQGDLLGHTGNTGNTGNIPHLHFSVQACDPVIGGSDGCPTVPSTFRNTEANPNGLIAGRTYVALALPP